MLGRRKLVIALVVIMALSLVGVANAKNETISVWIGWADLLPVYLEAAADFQADTGIEVEILAFPLREFERKLAVSIPAGEAPDIFVTSEYIIPQYIESGYVSLPPKDVSDFVWNSFDARTLELNTFGGQVYGVPQIGIARILYWNKDHFAEVGLDRAPVNWDELVEYAAKLAQTNDAGELVRTGISLRKFGDGSGVTEKFQIFLASAGGSILEQNADGKWRAAYNDELGQATLKLYIDLIHKFGTDSFDTKQDSEAFALGHTSMFVREFWPIPYFKEVAPDLNYGTSLIPGRIEGRSGTVYSTESAFVPESSKQKDTAWEFIMYFNQDKYVKDMFERIGWPAPRVDVDFSDVFEREPAYAVANDRPEGYIYSTYPPISASDEVWTKLGERLEAAFRDSSLVDNPSGIKKVLDDAAKETDNILKDHGLY